MCSKYIQFDKQLRTGTYGDSADFHSVPIGFTEFCNTRNGGVMIGGSPLHQYRFHCLRPSKQLHYPFHGTHSVFRACFPHIFPPSAEHTRKHHRRQIPVPSSSSSSTQVHTTEEKPTVPEVAETPEIPDDNVGAPLRRAYPHLLSYAGNSWVVQGRLRKRFTWSRGSGSGR